MLSLEGGEAGSSENTALAPTCSSRSRTRSFQLISQQPQGSPSVLGARLQGSFQKRQLLDVHPGPGPQQRGDLSQRPIVSGGLSHTIWPRPECVDFIPVLLEEDSGGGIDPIAPPLP